MGETYPIHVEEAGVKQPGKLERMFGRLIIKRESDKDTEMFNAGTRAAALVTLNKLGIEGIPKIYDITLKDRKRSVTIEKVPGEPLYAYDYLEEPEFADVTNKLTHIVKEVVYKGGILHNDITPRNVMYDKEAGTVYLVDFDSARFLDSTGTCTDLEGFEISEGFSAPEKHYTDIGSGISEGHGIDERSEIYSIACTVLALRMGSNIYTSEIQRHIDQKIPVNPKEIFEFVIPDDRKSPLVEYLLEQLELEVEKRSAQSLEEFEKTLEEKIAAS